MDKIWFGLSHEYPKTALTGFCFVFPEKGPGTSTRARELLPLSPLSVVVFILLNVCVLLPSKLASLLS